MDVSQWRQSGGRGGGYGARGRGGFQHVVYGGIKESGNLGKLGVGGGLVVC